MLLILAKALGFAAVIAIGYIMRKIDFFKQDDYKIITKLVLNFTLPAAILSGFVNFERQSIYFLLMLISLSWNIFLIFIGFILSFKKRQNKQNIFYDELNGIQYRCFFNAFCTGFSRFFRRYSNLYV